MRIFAGKKFRLPVVGSFYGGASWQVQPGKIFSQSVGFWIGFCIGVVAVLMAGALLAGK